MDSILEWIESLKRTESVIIVEGLKDKKVLAEFGVFNVVTLKKPLFRVVEELSHEEEVILLVDVDKEGKRIYGKLRRGFERFGVRVDDRFRNFLIKHTSLRQVEGLKHYILHSEKGV